MYKEKLETYFFVFLTARRFQKGIGSASNTKVERNYKSIYTSSITHPRKTEYAIQTKETMQIEQKVIVLRTKEYCTYCVKNKGGWGYQCI